MKKIVLSIACMFFVCCYCLGQDYFLIRHIGISDRHIPNLLITKEDTGRKVFKSDSTYFRNMFVTIIDLKKEEYEFLLATAYKREFLEKGFTDFNLGKFEIIYMNAGKKEQFFSESPRSSIYLKTIIDGIKQKLKNEKLLHYLEEIYRMII